MQYGMHMGLLFYFVCTAQKKLKLEKEAEALAAQDDGEKCSKVFFLMRCASKLMVVRSASQMKRSAS